VISFVSWVLLILAAIQLTCVSSWVTDELLTGTTIINRIQQKNDNEIESACRLEEFHDVHGYYIDYDE